MEQFGFTISKARVINYDANDRKVAIIFISASPLSNCALNAAVVQLPVLPAVLRSSACGKFRSLSGVEKMKRQGRSSQNACFAASASLYARVA